MTESQAVAFLGKFLFSYEHARGPVSNLSGGERSRLQMALLMLSGANFLLLDEPTNNLDIPSAEVLEDAPGRFRRHCAGDFARPLFLRSGYGPYPGIGRWRLERIHWQL